MKRLTGRSVLLLTLCAAGCSFDFTDLPNETRAGFHLQIFADRRTDQLDLNGGLSPGFGTDAALRTVMTELLVSGRAVPFSEGPNGQRAYAAEWSLSTELPANGTMEIRAPELKGLAAAETPVFAVALPVATGGDTIHVGPGEDLVLHVSLAESDPEQVQWLVDVIDSAGEGHLALQSRGHPPAQIAMSRTWFEPGPSVQTVRLYVRQDYASRSDRYLATASIEALLQWTVVFTTDPDT